MSPNAYLPMLTHLVVGIPTSTSRSRSSEVEVAKVSYLRYSVALLANLRNSHDDTSNRYYCTH